MIPSFPRCRGEQVQLKYAQVKLHLIYISPLSELQPRVMSYLSLPDCTLSLGLTSHLTHCSAGAVQCSSLQHSTVQCISAVQNNKV